MKGWAATLAGAALWACAIPAGHGVPWPPEGVGGSGGPGGANIGGANMGGGGAPESFQNAIQWNSACAIASANDTNDLTFGADDFTIELWYQPLELPELADGLLSRGG